MIRKLKNAMPGPAGDMLFLAMLLSLVVFCFYKIASATTLLLHNN
jgi:hypothetical protein